MVELTFYGGVDEIGGNKVLCVDGESRAFLDFGLSFSQRGRFYEEFLNPRTHSAVGDLLALGLVPDLPGLYRDDPVGGIPPATAGEGPAVDGVLLSHPHADHAGYIPLLRPDIPIHATAAAWRLLAAGEEAGQSGLEREIVTVKRREPYATRYEQIARRFRAVSPGKRFSVGGLEVEAFAVDHSVPGAVGYVLYTSAGPVAYTGDFRIHGRRPEATRGFVEALARIRPRVLLTEGTNITEEAGGSEQDVAAAVAAILTEARGRLVLCTFSPRDLDRLTTFWLAARDAGRRLVVNLRAAHLLAAVADCGLGTPGLDDVGIYIPRKRWGCYDEKEYAVWERGYLGHDGALRAADLGGDPAAYLVYLDYFSLGELIDIEPPPGSVMIHSQVEPFNEQMEFDFQRFCNWLERFGITYAHAHASGHIYGAELRRVIGDIDPDICVPLHTESPDGFAGAARNVRLVTQGETLRL